jgi:hypothetical protein
LLFFKHNPIMRWWRCVLCNRSTCIEEKQQVPIMKSLFWSDRGSNPRSTTQEASTLTITPSIRFISMSFKPNCDYNLPKTVLGIYFSTNTEYDIYLTCLI